MPDLAKRVLDRLNPYHAECPGGLVNRKALDEFLDSKGIHNQPSSNDIKLEIARIKKRKIGTLEEDCHGRVLATRKIGNVSVRMEFEDFEAAALNLFFHAEGASEKLVLLWDDNTTPDAFLVAYSNPGTDLAVSRALRRFSEWSLAELFEVYAHLTAARQPSKSGPEILQDCWMKLEELLNPSEVTEPPVAWLTRVLRTVTCPSKWDCVICVGTEIHRVLWASVGGLIVE